MPTKWIVLVNRIDARIFTSKTFRLVDHFKNDIGREKNRALTTDKPGRAPGKFASRTGIHSLSGEKNPHEDVAVAFAKKVGAYLEKQKKAGHFDELLLIAEPKMLGRLKSSMGKTVAEHAEWIGKDLGKVTTHELKKFMGVNVRAPSTRGAS